MIKKSIFLEYLKSSLHQQEAPKFALQKNTTWAIWMSFFNPGFASGTGYFVPQRWI